jgi:signal transduction histidine kinase
MTGIKGAAVDESSVETAKVAVQTLALLHEQADAVRAELQSLRQDLARVREEFSGEPGAQLLQANEHLVLAAMKSQAIADAARRRLNEFTRVPSATRPLAPASGERARAEYQARIQDLRQANERLVVAALNSQQLEAVAEESHSRQITFLAMAAHELRNPLLPLRLAAQMLTRSRTEEQLLEVQQAINSQVSQMARLIGDLLDGSRVSTGRFRLQFADVDLRAVLDQAIETCQPAMEARRHRFTCAVPATLPGRQADALRLVQVFSNLLDNAAKYTPEGGEIALVADVRDDAICVTVSDNGIGITAPALPRVFELFVQDEHAAIHNQGGLGIGLAVVRELVEAHGGTVVASSRGKDLGSQFVVTLPLAAAADATQL